jgi:cardiolipin synthase (CMP-forming)
VRLILRPNRPAVISSLIYVAGGFIWVLVTRPTHPWHDPWPLLLLFLMLSIAEGFVPGIANQISFARVFLAVPAFVYALGGSFGAIAVVVALAGLSDLVDGTVARRFEHPSNLGGGLDPVVDGVFMGSLTIGLALGGALPLWLALVVIARYLLPALAGGLLILLGRRPELRHTLTGQVSTALILVLVGGVCLFRGLNQDASALVSAAEVVIPIATAATFVHLAWVSRRPVTAPEPG